MDVNAPLVRKMRLSRGWTQQHLADTCNISLRTIQRVERFGSAAPDTVMELCAVLEITQEALVIAPENNLTQPKSLPAAIVVTMMIVTLVLGITLGAAVTFFAFQ